MMYSRLDYVNVVRWLNQQGVLAHLCLAQRTIPEGEAHRLAREIVGPGVRIRVKRITRSWAWGSHTINLACNDARQVRIDAVLHECAHILDKRKPRQMRGLSHGEPFKRTYARLLREYTASPLEARR